MKIVSALDKSEVTIKSDQPLFIGKNNKLVAASCLRGLMLRGLLLQISSMISTTGLHAEVTNIGSVSGEVSAQLTPEEKEIQRNNIQKAKEAAKSSKVPMKLPRMPTCTWTSKTQTGILDPDMRVMVKIYRHNSLVCTFVEGQNDPIQKEVSIQIGTPVSLTIHEFMGGAMPKKSTHMSAEMHSESRQHEAA